MNLSKTLLRKQRGFTFVELLVVIILLAFLVVYFFPPLSSGGKRKRKNTQTQCVSTLKQVSTAMHMFQADHEGKLPMDVSTNEGGSKEWFEVQPIPNIAAVQTYLALRSEIKNPKMLICTEDKASPAKTWEGFTSTNISYFLEPSPGIGEPTGILMGDKNILANGKQLSLLIDFQRGITYEWGPGLHTKKNKKGTGNLLLLDGSIKMPNQNALNEVIRSGSLFTKRRNSIMRPKMPVNAEELLPF